MIRLSQIQAFAAKYQWLASPEGSRAQCINASINFLKSLGVAPEDMHLYMDSNLEEDVDEHGEHHWVRIGKLNVDWTARQFDPTAPFPKMWLSR
jgi:hypothetical protein